MNQTSSNLRVIISGGGTGGHVYPAIAIAHAIKAEQPAAELLFIGAKGKLEMEKVPEAGYAIEGLWISGLQRKLSWKLVAFPFKLVSSLWRSWRIFRKYKPDVAVGVGGYASGPMLAIAALSGTPIVLQEQNGYAGITNKLVAGKAAKICVAYPSMEKFFPAEKLLFTGNPVRNDLANVAALKEEGFRHFKLDPNKKTVFAFGGSLGSLVLNQSIAAGVHKLLAEGFQLIWGTGKIYFDRYNELFSEPRAEGLVMLPYIARMDLAYAIADLVVARAGALTISEISLTGKPSILVPSPNVAEDHQNKNAQAMASEGAAVVVADAEANEKLVAEILAVMADDARLAELSKHSLRMARPNAATEIAEQVIQLAKQPA
jgi:UDP-N-acetylglucosamine--N-acetylmuramyl-(pentapeptide) pyrophosphoryl-undecaprenol N-acetylglucosamine transferase